MNVWTRLRALFKPAAEPAPPAENVVWHDEVECLRRLRAQRIELATRPHLIALPVREM